jgi:iron complex outermembrane receptor protein
VSVRLIVTTLIATSAMSAVANAQNAPANPPPAPATTPAPAQNIGIVTITEPTPRPSFAQPGLTAAPTDITQNTPAPAAQNAANVGVGNSPSIGTTPGGVTRTDIGGGYMINEEAKKTRSTVTRDAIDKLSPTANPYQMVNLLPGVVASSTDNTGLNGGNIRIRGFNSDHLGLTIEGMPVNDSGNYALFPQEYVDGPNISHISIAQGYQELDSPHVGAAGGVINIYMRDPAKEAGGFASVSLGSNALRREFVRLETGEVNKFSAYLSYSNLMKDNWAGPGTDNRSHVDFKAKWGDNDNAVRFAAIYNYAVNGNYVAPKLSDFNTPGYNPAWNPTLASTFFNPQTKNGNSYIDQSANGTANYYKYRINPFQNLILSAPSNFKVSENVKFDTVPYFWYGYGNGGSITSLSEQNDQTSKTLPTAFYWGNMKVQNVDLGGLKGLNDKIAFYNPSITETYRPGVINKFTFNLGDHQLVAGNWFEFARHRQTAPYVPLTADGGVDDPFAGNNQFRLPATALCYTPASTGANQVTCPTGPMQRRDQLTQTTTNAVFVGDTWKIDKSWTLDLGVKQLWVHREMDNYLPFAADPNQTLDDTATLPQAAISYKMDKENKVFASVGTTFRSAPNFTQISSYSATSGAYTPINPLPPERGTVFEVGHRYQGKLFSTSLSVFNGYFENFQQSTNVIDTRSGSTGTVSETVNVGRLVNYGINGEIGTRPMYNFRTYIGFELLQTRMLDNMQAGGKLGNGNINDFLPTAGKQLPGAPNVSLGVGLDYDDGHWFANAQYKYIGAQFSTYMNDEVMQSFGRVDAGLGYRFSDVGYMKKPEIKLNLFNLTNARQLVGVNGLQTNAQTTTGTGGSSISGNAPTYYMGQGISGLVTFSTGF